MIDQQKLDALSDEFMSKFSIVRQNPDVIANMCSPSGVEKIKHLVKKHMCWDVVMAIPTGQLTSDYDVYMFARSGKLNEGEKIYEDSPV